ncbi:MAG TPA: ferritin-like protein [Pseudonocardiaceae bacterium]|nr:ferritin-like protein [Pseudonocardiaceae bacterium]
MTDGVVLGDQELPFELPKNVAELQKYLQGALEIEHLTIPPYLTAMYTIRAGTNSDAHYTIRSVVLEEMLHMTLVANLLNAVGGRPRVADPDFVRRYPARLPYSALDVKIPLQHFSPAAIRTFLLIERPQHLDDPLRSGQGWTSIGQFYDFIRQGLLALVAELGADKVFCGRLERQVGPEDFYNSGGEALPVTDVTSALLALRVITEQGEGLRDSIFDSDDQLFGEDRQVAHYFRFNEILTGRTYGPHDIPDAPPTGPSIDVRWEDAYRIDPNASVADYARYEDKAVYEHAVAFNDAYAELLAHLEIAFNGRPRVMILGVPAMLRLRDLAERLYRNPHPDPDKGSRGYFASATFEIDRNQIDRGHELVSARVRTASLNASEPADLSAVEPS